MSRDDMKKISSSHHEHKGGHEGRGRLGAPLDNPKVGEPTGQEYVKGDAQIQREGKRKDHEKPIGRVKKCGFEVPKKGRPAEEVGVPKGQVAPLELLESELPPTNIIRGHIRSRKGEDLGRPRVQETPKEGEGGEGQKSRGGPGGKPGFPARPSN